MFLFCLLLKTYINNETKINIIISRLMKYVDILIKLFANVKKKKQIIL